MQTLILSVLCLICNFGTVVADDIDEPCRTDAYPPPKNDEIANYVINLDSPPIDRWTHVVKDKHNELLELIEIFKQLIGEKNLGYVNALFGLLTSFMPQPYQDEIRGISIATGIGRGEVAVYNVFYELFTACTSIVGQDESGNIFHARNMDFGLLMGWDPKNNTWLVSEWLRKLVINVDFQRNGKTVFKGITFVGYVGVLTAMKPDVFSFSIDERFALDGGWVGLVKWALQLGKSDARWLGFFTREVMENATSYDEAKAMFSNIELIAPAYFILGGIKPGEACVITRSRTKPIDVWELQSKDNPDQWFLVETNYDHWEKPMFIDDRRTPAKKCMTEMTQKSMGFKGLYNVLSTKSIRNKLTVYTALMEAKGGRLEVYKQDCPDPCWPW